MGGQKRKKGYYVHHQQKKQAFGSKQFQTGLRGFLVTCNNRERECVRECYNVLNEYLDRRYPKDSTADDSGDEAGGDIEAELAKEVAAIKASAEQHKQLYQCDTKCRNILFIVTPKHVNPLLIAADIFSEIYESRKQLTRYALRLIPVSITCRANEEGISKAIEELLAEERVQQAPSFQVMCRIRNNSDLSRTAIIESVATLMKAKLPNCRVNFDDPALILNIDVMTKIACVTFLSDFNKFRKYNLVELATERKDAIDINGSANAKQQDSQEIDKDESKSPDQTVIASEGEIASADKSNDS